MLFAILWSVLGLVIAGGIFMCFLVALMIFKNTLYRSGKRERSRDCVADALDEQKEMFRIGTEWSAQYKDITESLHIVHDGLNLYGEYINFGYDRCAVIIQGRTESLLYSYYYAEVYAKNGYNILTIDTRAHGLSDSNFLTAGIKEHGDLIAWLELIKEKYGIKSFTTHGICIGGATSIYAYCATKKDMLIDKMVVDGLYTSYYEIFKNHIIERKKPVFVFVYLTFFYTFLCTGANLLKYTPFKCMKEIDAPILFIWSEQDIYCVPEKGNELFEECASKYKEKRFFPVGRHSFVRYNDSEGYDKVISEFLKKNDKA